MKKISDILRLVTTAFTVATIVYAIRTKQSSGRLLNVPYDFRFPTTQRVKERWWNPDDPRVFTPHVFGVGWSLNLFQLRELLLGETDGGSELADQEEPPS